MKKAFVWCRIFSKRQLKRASTIFILLTMLLLTIAMSFMSKSITASVDVGFCPNSDSQADNNSIISNISEGLSHHDGIINFIKYNSAEELSKDVESGKVQCGYIFDENFSEAVVKGNAKNTIELIEPPENTYSLLSNLVVLATVVEYSACDMLIEDILSQDFFANIAEVDLDILREEYSKYASNGSTFSFDYNTMYQEYEGSSDTIDISSYLVTPVKGIIAIIIFVSALTGGVGWFNDSQNAIYANIPPQKCHFLRLLTIVIPTILAGLMGYISIITVGLHTTPGRELFTILIYSLLCIVFTYILTYAVRKNIFCSLIPVFILGSVICCPIFFNLGNIIPAMKVLQKLFLPTYYFMF